MWQPETPLRPRAAATRSALTLIDLTIAVLVMGILAAVAAPRLGNAMRMARLRAAANQVASHVEYVRRTAINRGSFTNFIVLSNLDRYGSTQVDFPDRPGQPLLVSVQDTFDASFEISASFDSQDRVFFDFEGTPRLSGGAAMQQGVISVSSDRGVYDIWVAAGTGQTTVSLRTSLIGALDGNDGGAGGS